MRTDGSGRKDLSSSPSPDSSPVVSPNGKSIAFVRGAGWSGAGSPETEDVWVMDADGGRQVALASGPHDELDPSWAPDSRSVAFEDVDYADCQPGERYCAHTSVSLVGPNGRRRLRADAQAPRFASARDVLVFEDLVTENAEPLALSRISARRRGYLVLTRCPRSASIHNAVWSRDARRIAFEQRGAVWVIGSRGRGKRRLSSGSAPAWSPASDQLAFLDAERLTVIRPRSRARRNVLDRVRFFAWSPKGKRFAVVRSIPGGFDQLFIVRADGRGLRRVTNESTEIIGPPAWSRNGSKLFYTVRA